MKKGRSRFYNKQYLEAIKSFQAFLYAPYFKDHPFRDDADWRIAESYKQLGEHKNALSYLSKMYDEKKRGVPSYANPELSTLYIADVLLSTSELDEIVSTEIFPNLQPYLQYTLAERYLADMNYEMARLEFEKVIANHGSLKVENTVYISKPVSFGELAKMKLQVLETIEHYQKDESDEADLLLAGYLETYDVFSPFENELRLYIPFFHSSRYQPVTEEYLTSRSRYYISAKLYENFIKNHPNDPRVPDLMIKIGESYEAIASWEDLPQTPDFLKSIREEGLKYYQLYLEMYPDKDKEQFDTAMEHSGSIFLARCQNISSPDPYSCDLESVQGMREAYKKLIMEFPSHHLSNNMMNWVAWSYCYEANYPGMSDEQYKYAYTKALETYQNIELNYPDGIIGGNARNNIPIIKEKLANPSDRPSPYKVEWGWPDK